MRPKYSAEWPVQGKQPDSVAVGINSLPEKKAHNKKPDSSGRRNSVNSSQLLFWIFTTLGIVDAPDDEVEGEGTNPNTPATVNSSLAESASSTGTVVQAVVQPTPIISSTGGTNSLASATKQIQESVINEINAKARALMNQWTAAILDPVKKAQQIEALLPTIRQIVAQQHPSAAGVVNFTSHSGQPIPDVAAMVHQALQPMKPGAMMMPSAKPPPAAAIPAKAGSSDYIDPTTNNFVTTLSINDYPPQARHRVSHKVRTLLYVYTYF